MTAAKRVTLAQDRVHVPFVVASLLLGIFGGFTLAVSLPVEAALGGFDVSWVAHAQVHGHLQVIGFAGLFVLGMAMRLAPRFGRGDLALPRLVRPAFVLLVTGLLLRTIGQPLAHESAFATLLAVGAFAELLGAVMFVAILGATLAPGLRNLEPHVVLLFGAPVWLAVQAALGAWWLGELASEAAPILEHTRNGALVNIQFFGVLLSAILGVGMRSFPTFFGMPPPNRVASILIPTLLHGGLALWSGAAIARAEMGVDTVALGALGAAVVGVAMVFAVVTFGLGRRKHRMSAASRGFIWALQPALMWLAVAGLGLAWTGARGVIDGGGLGTGDLDAIRHIFAVGVVTLAIVAMAQLMLPEFASERLVRPPAPWRGAAFGAALSLAAVLRGVLPWTGLAGDLEYWAMAFGGAIGLVAVAVFGFLYWRARRGHLAYTARMAALRARSTELRMAEG